MYVILRKRRSLSEFSLLYFSTEFKNNYYSFEKNIFMLQRDSQESKCTVLRNILIIRGVSNEMTLDFSNKISSYFDFDIEFKVD